MADEVWRKKGKIMTEIGTTNKVASLPPELRPTAKPTAHANFYIEDQVLFFLVLVRLVTVGKQSEL